MGIFEETIESMQERRNHELACALCLTSLCVLIYIVISLGILAGAITMIVFGHQRDSIELLIPGYFLLSLWVLCCCFGCYVRSKRRD